ncbi:hypothetical protein BDR03DRAFT_980296 [Suillus americanus]|nr:hypothetical protein BDR03DRAFT_980296 [Suillus americanus]
MGQQNSRLLPTTLAAHTNSSLFPSTRESSVPSYVRGNDTTSKTLTVKQLQALCREHGLNVRGRQVDLIERLAAVVPPLSTMPSTTTPTIPALRIPGVADDDVDDDGTHSWKYSG